MKEILKEFVGYDVYAKLNNEESDSDVAFKIIDLTLLCLDYDALKKSLEEIK